MSVTFFFYFINFIHYTQDICVKIRNISYVTIFKLILSENNLYGNNFDKGF